MTEWRYEIKYGPEGEANYAWVYKGDDMIATMKTHHAVEIVKALSASPAGVVKPLEWKLSWGPDQDGDECHVASTPFGTVAVERLYGKWQWRYCFDEYYDEDQTQCDSLEDGKAAAQAMWNSRISPLIDARIMSAIEPAGVGVETPPPSSHLAPQCCMCGKKNLSTIEGDGGSECELEDGRWVCSAECWDRAVEPAPSQHAAPEPIVCDVLTMQHSSGFPDHFTRVRVGQRELTLFMSKIKGRCEYHAAELNWLLNGSEKPHILDFSDDEPEGLSEYLKLIEASTPPPQPRASVPAALKGDEQ